MHTHSEIKREESANVFFEDVSKELRRKGREEEKELIQYQKDTNELVLHANAKLSEFIKEQLPLLRATNPDFEENDPRFERAICLLYEAYQPHVSSEKHFKLLKEADSICYLTYKYLIALASEYFKHQDTEATLSIVKKVNALFKKGILIPLEYRIAGLAVEANLYLSCDDIQLERFRIARTALIEMMYIDVEINPKLDATVEELLATCWRSLVDVPELLSHLQKNNMGFSTSDVKLLYTKAKAGTSISNQLHFLNAAILKFRPHIAPITYHIRCANLHFALTNWVEALMNISIAIWKSHKTQTASSSLKELYFTRALLWLKLRELEKAKSDYESSSNFNPAKFVLALCNFANTLPMQENAVAIEYYSYALVIDPHCEAAKTALYQIHHPNEHKNEPDSKKRRKKKKSSAQSAPSNTFPPFKPSKKGTNCAGLNEYLLQEQKKQAEQEAKEKADAEAVALTRAEESSFSNDMPSSSATQRNRRKKANRKARLNKNSHSGTVTDASLEEINDAKGEEPSPLPTIFIPPAISAILHQLDSAWIVGGFVRDCVMQQLDVKVDHEEKEETSYLMMDIDIVAKRPQPSIPSEFKQNKFEENLYRSKVDQYDIDLWLSENIDDTAFLYADSFRRDFTVNALYLRDDNISDPTGRAITDIQNKLIQTIKPADESFKEDPIRILRAINFCNKLKFSLSEDILNAIPCNAHLLLEQEPGKVCFWLNKILSGPLAAQNCILLLQTGVLAKLFPAFSASFKSENQSLMNTIITLCEGNRARHWQNTSREILVTLLVNCNMNVNIIAQVIDQNPILKSYRAHNPAFMCLFNRIISIKYRQPKIGKNSHRFMPQPSSATPSTPASVAAASAGKPSILFN